MKIMMEKFGASLSSRPAGREAALAARAYSLPTNTNEKVELDFSNVEVLTPSWLDEFLQTLSQHLPKGQITFTKGDNASVLLSFQTLDELGSL